MPSRFASWRSRNTCSFLQNGVGRDGALRRSAAVGSRSGEAAGLGRTTVLKGKWDPHGLKTSALVGDHANGLLDAMLFSDIFVKLELIVGLMDILPLSETLCEPETHARVAPSAHHTLSGVAS